MLLKNKYITILAFAVFLVLKFQSFILKSGNLYVFTLFRNSLFSNRLITILLLGCSSGLPLALVGSTLQAWFTEEHVNLISIGVLSLIGLPYTLKFLWAPLMDHYEFKWLGRRRSWIFLMQAGVALSLFALAVMQPSQEAKMMGAVALLLAFFSASQDVAITAYQTDIVTDEERGLGVAYYIFGYRVATLIAGGIALLMANDLGWRFTYQCMAVLILCNMIVTYKAPAEYALTTKSETSLLQTLYAAWLDLLQRERMLTLLMFIVLYKFGDALALQLMTNFLLSGLGFSLSEVAWAYKVVSFVATILGGFAGGILLMRWDIYRALLIFGLAQTFSNLMFVILAYVGKSYILLTTSMFIENFCSGLSTAALFAFMMSICNHRYSASQFALLSAIASLGRVFLGPIASVMVLRLGWVQFYIWSFVLCFPGLILLVMLKDKVRYHAQTASD